MMMMMVLRLLIESVHHIDCIPDICHFFYTGKIYKSKIVHPKKHKKLMMIMMMTMRLIKESAHQY